MGGWIQYPSCRPGGVPLPQRHWAAEEAGVGQESKRVWCCQQGPAIPDLFPASHRHWARLGQPPH